MWLSKKLILIGIGCMALCFGSCGGGKGDFTSGYFDIKPFVQQEAQHLAQQNISVLKIAYLDGKEEKKQMQFSLDAWQSELAPFNEADIDKPAFVQKYRVDTLTMDSSTCISYTATEKHQRTRWMKVFFKDGKAFRTEAFLEADNPFYKSQQTLVYDHTKGYSVTGSQDILILGKDNFKVEGQFIP
ncbi:MAG: hypothetical protein SFW35_02280 [Chitinophagales bacterium]|nr:hypothetical protein [Chitinophagales bacterium]